jgi:uncharacterized OB-fold protein
MSDSEAKPQPHPSEVSAPYWQGTAEGKLRLQRCERCGKVRHYPQLLCPDCYSDRVEWIAASGLGTVHSWTVAHHAFHPAFRGELPYTLAVVDLPEGPRALGRLEGAPRLGLPVRITFPQVVDGIALPVFLPLQTEG